MITDSGEWGKVFILTPETVIIMDRND